MALDTEMMNSRGQLPRPRPAMSPMMQMAQGEGEPDMARIIELLKQLQMQQGGGGLGTSPMGQQYPLMGPQGAPPGYRMNNVDPRLMQVLQARQAGG